MHFLAGADVNAESSEGETPLMTATMWHYNKMLQMLLREGAGVEGELSSQVAPVYCSSVLGLALAVHNLQAARLLFYAGASDIILDHPEDIPVLKDSNDSEEEAFINCIKDLRSQRPRSLKLMSRKVIRGILGTNIRQDIHRIGLPGLMEDYVLLEDVI